MKNREEIKEISLLCGSLLSFVFALVSCVKDDKATRHHNAKIVAAAINGDEKALKEIMKVSEDEIYAVAKSMINGEIKKDAFKTYVSSLKNPRALTALMYMLIQEKDKGIKENAENINEAIRIVYQEQKALENPQKVRNLKVVHPDRVVADKLAGFLNDRARS